MRPFTRGLPKWAPAPSGGLNLTNYSDRTLSPEDTVRRVWPFLPSLGVTRLARQTDLDRVGVPSWAAFRPNAKTLAGAQGKGLSDAAACASAMMEAVEVAVAENPTCERCWASARELSADDQRWFDPDRLLPLDSRFDTTRKICWVRGISVGSAEVVWIPADAVDLDSQSSELKGICKTSNGLASGNTFDEALFHALCELVERDATSLWSLLSDDVAQHTCFAPGALNDALVDKLLEQIVVAGFRIRLFDQTSNLGIPVMMAVLGPETETAAGSLELTAGYGAHPVPSRAAIRAITEAAQSRVTSIAASRDDIHTASFDSAAPESVRGLLEAQPVSIPPQGMASGTPLSALLATVLKELKAHGCEAFAVRLSEDGLPFEVVKVLSPDLEDRGANINWRPGWRSFDAIAEA